MLISSTSHNPELEVTIHAPKQLIVRDVDTRVRKIFVKQLENTAMPTLDLKKARSLYYAMITGYFISIIPLIVLASIDAGTKEENKITQVHTAIMAICFAPAAIFLTIITLGLIHKYGQFCVLNIQAGERISGLLNEPVPEDVMKQLFDQLTKEEIHQLSPSQFSLILKTQLTAVREKFNTGCLTDEQSAMYSKIDQLADLDEEKIFEFLSNPEQLEVFKQNPDEFSLIRDYLCEKYNEPENRIVGVLKSIGSTLNIQTTSEENQNIAYHHISDVDESSTSETDS